MEDPIVVQLLTGANVIVQQRSEVRVIPNLDNPQAKSAKPLESDTQRMDEFTNRAKFHLKFLQGSRKNVANLKFTMNVLIGSHQLTLESNLSHPFIVITNECQYEESEALLIKSYAFGIRVERFRFFFSTKSPDLFLIEIPKKNEITWASFANLLQRHFLKATRQDSSKPQRSLSRYEINYINQKFFGIKSFFCFFF